MGFGKIIFIVLERLNRRGGLIGYEIVRKNEGLED
jgi:hypothetical protein